MGGVHEKIKMCGGASGIFPVRPPLRISNGIALTIRYQNITFKFYQNINFYTNNLA